MSPTSPAPGTLHPYLPTLVAFEHQPHPASPTPRAPPLHTLLFLDGLYGNLLNTSYARLLSQRLPDSWRLAEVQLPSSGATGWCTGSLRADAAALAHAVAYFRALRPSGGKLVLMGHSTGCQTAAEYVVGPWAEPAEVVPGETMRRRRQRGRVDGVVLQGGVGDAEALREERGEQALRASVEVARAWVRDGRGEDVMPRATVSGGVFGDQVPNARRWISLASVDGEGDDDYFSSDASDEKVQRIWGSGGFAGQKVPVMPLLSGSDESMPKHVDKEALVAKWITAVTNAHGQVGQGSGVIPGASHNLNDSPEHAREDLCKRVLQFLETIENE